MAGAGKSEVSWVFQQQGFVRIRFGDITDAEVLKRRLPLNEESERRIREILREEYGMAAYALLNLPKIDAALAKADVVIDGLYSWEEYILLQERYGDNFGVVAVWASPPTRYRRLSNRIERPLTITEAAARDKAEIENINKGGPIAMANITLCNEYSLAELLRETLNAITRLRNG
jgi:dephospho-CoA kinase